MITPNFGFPEILVMNRLFRTLLLSLIFYSCEQPAEQKAAYDDWQRLQSYLDKNGINTEGTGQSSDSTADLFLRPGTADSTALFPWSLMDDTSRQERLSQEQFSLLERVGWPSSNVSDEAAAVRSFTAIGQLLLESRDWRKSEIFLRDALKMADSFALESEKPFVLYTWAAFLRKAGRDSAAIDTLKLAAGMFGASADQRHTGLALEALGEIHLEQKDSIVAASYFRSALDLFKARDEDRMHAALPLYHMTALSLNRDKDSALFFFNESIKVDSTHQFPRVYLNGLILLGHHFIRLQQPETALPFLDSAIQFATDNNLRYLEWNARLRQGIAYLEKGDKPLFDSAMRSSLSVALASGDFSVFQLEVQGWLTFCEQNGLTRAASRMQSWVYPKKIMTDSRIKPTPSRKWTEYLDLVLHALNQREKMVLPVTISAVLLLLIFIWRLRVYRRNKSFLQYRERAQKLAADRSYRRDILAYSNEDSAADGNQLVIERERRVLAMERLFEMENLHLQPDTNFSEICERLKEKEDSFRSIVADMYDVEFEYLLKELRIEEAVRLLRQGKKVSTLPSACGFASASEFRRTFRRITGVNPRRFLKMPMRPIR